MQLVRVGPQQAEWNPSITRYNLHNALVHAIVAHPDGVHAISSGEDSRLLLWEIDSGRRVGEIEGHSGPVNDLAVCGRVMASAGDDRTVRVWDLDDGRVTLRHVLRGHEAFVRQVAISDEHVVSACEDRIVRVWSLADGRLLGALEGHRECVQSVGIGRDGRYAITASLEHALLVWDLETMTAAPPLYNAGGWVHHLGFGHLHMSAKNHTGVGHVDEAPRVIQFLDGGRLLTASDGVILWDFDARAERARVDDFAWGIQAAAVDATRVFLGSHSEIRGMTLDLREVLFRAPAPASGTTALCLLGDTLLVGAHNGAVWKLDVGGWVPEPRHMGGARDATAAPGERRVATMDSDAVLRLWDFETGVPCGVFDRYPEPNDKPYAFSADGRLLATTRGHAAPAVCVWDVDTGEVVRELHHVDEHGHGYSVHSVLFDGEELLVGPSGKEPIQRWYLDGERVTAFQEATKQVSTLFLVDDVLLTLGYFEPADAEAEKDKYVRSVTHLQGWSRDGELLWTRGGQYVPGAKWPTRFDTLHIVPGGSVLTNSGEDHGEIALLDPHTGALQRRWKLGSSVSVLGVDDDVAYVRTTRRDDEQRQWITRVALEGDQEWSYEIPARARHLSVACAANRLVWTEERDLVLVELRTGEELARTRLDEKAASVLLRSDGARVFVGTDAGRARVYAFVP